MLGVFNLILLFGMCTMVTPSGFFYARKEFKPFKRDDEAIIDFSQLEVKDFRYEDVFVTYLKGPISVNSELNDSFQVEYTISEYNAFSEETGSDTKTVSLCDFFNNEYQKHFLPLAMNHNDFPSKSGGSYCPIKSGEYNILDVDNLDQLDAPTDLKDGFGGISIKFLLNQKLVGGFRTSLVAYVVSEVKE